MSSVAAMRRELAAFVGGQLVESVWVRRLHRISFLGTLDFHPKSRRASTRYVHSLGVASLGLWTAKSLRLAPSEARHLVAACLLHDVGHYPLSHAAEPAFAQRLGATHHDVGRWLVCGQGPISRMKSLVQAVKDCGLCPDRVWGLIDGSPQHPKDRPVAALLKAPINLDTLDGIVRAAKDFRMSVPKLPEQVFCWSQGSLALTAHGVAYADAFWRLKDSVYSSVINLPSNIVAEARLCDRVAGQEWDRVFADFDRFDDTRLLKDVAVRPSAPLICPGDDRAFELRAQPGFGELMSRTQKRYLVDKDAVALDPADPLPVEVWGQRYRHRRVKVGLVTRREQLDLPSFDWHPQEAEY